MESSSIFDKSLEKILKKLSTWPSPTGNENLFIMKHMRWLFQDSDRESVGEQSNSDSKKFSSLPFRSSVHGRVRLALGEIPVAGIVA
jgi:hypothetical protein